MYFRCWCPKAFVGNLLTFGERPGLDPLPLRSVSKTPSSAASIASYLVSLGGSTRIMSGVIQGLHRGSYDIGVYIGKAETR